MIVDGICVILSWLIAYYLRFFSFLATPKGVPNIALYLKLIPFIAIIWAATFFYSGHYKGLKKLYSPATEFFKIFKISVLATAIFIAVSFFYEEYKYSRGTLLIFFTLHPFGIFLGRCFLKKILNASKRKAQKRFALIIGHQQGLKQNIAFIKSSLGYEGLIHGFISLNNNNVASGLDFEGLEPHPQPDDWSDFFASHDYETVFLCVSKSDQDFLQSHFEELSNQVTDIQIIPDISYLSSLASGVELVGKTPIYNTHESPLSGVNIQYKRILDIVGSLMALTLFLPAMALISAWLKLSSSASVLYKQERMGVDGSKFSILKFRTMPPSVEDKSGAVWAKKGDQRATKFGQLLRKTSLDELPQLINVLRGDMSLVGPRPERPVFVNQFRKNVPGYMLRHKVKAGITGWAQVNGWRGNTSIEKRIECDLHYIQNWSFWLDIKILFLTILKGFVNPNAY